jgi:hypothetical protein
VGILLVNDVGQVTTVVQDHVQGLVVLEASDGLLNAPVVLFLGLALPGKDGDTGSSDAMWMETLGTCEEHERHENIRSSSMVLSGEDVLSKQRQSKNNSTRFCATTLTQEDQVTSAPRAVRVSMRTAVWMVLYTTVRVFQCIGYTWGSYMWRQPAMRAPLRGWLAACCYPSNRLEGIEERQRSGSTFFLKYMRPGISFYNELDELGVDLETAMRIHLSNLDFLTTESGQGDI